MVLRDRIGIDSWHLNIEFELKCAVGFPRYFVGTFAKHYICLGSPIVVDSSSVLYPCDSFMLMLALASAKRQLLLSECSVYILDFASGLQSPAESLKQHPNHRTHNATSLRNGSIDCKADVHGCQLCILLGQ